MKINHLKFFFSAILLTVLCITFPAFASNNPADIPAVPSIASLKALGVASNLYPVVSVTGYYAQGDGFSSVFIWSPASTATVTVCGPFMATGVSTGRWVSLSGISLRGCGAKGDGSTNDSSAINAAALTGGKLIAEPGNYLIGTIINLQTGDDITCQPGAKFSFDASGAFYPITISNKSNVRVRGCTGQNTTSPALAGRAMFAVFGSSDIWIEHNVTTGTGLIFTNSAAACDCYAGVNLSNISKNIHVNYNNVGNGATSGIADDGMVFQYTQGIEVAGNIVSGTYQGIRWWGGDAGVDGLTLSNIRWDLNASFVNNVVYSVSQGCLWGSMGQSISITGNTVKDCGDTGLDDEGGVANTFSGNTCENAVNGCLTTFYLPSNIIFSGNTITSSSGLLARTYNSTVNPYSTSVSYVGNTFKWTGTNFGSIDTAAGPLDVLSFSGNTVTDAVVAYGSANQHTVNVTGNHFQYTKTPGAPFNAVTVTNYFQNGATDGVANVSDNDFQSEVTQSGSSYAIAITGTDPNAISFAVINNNRIFLSGACAIHWTGASISGFQPAFSINANIMGGCYTRTESGSQVSQGLLQNNADAVGTYFPSPSVAAAGTWDAGQIFLNRPPTASGYIGMVETTGGSPGTQKNYGAVVP